MSAATGAPPATPAGNSFDKYGSCNPVVRRLMAGFERALGELFEIAAPDSVLDVGCGEGVLTYRWAQLLGSGRVVGVDLSGHRLEHEWSTRRRPNLEFRSGTAEALRFAPGEFELVAGIELLEHVRDPQAVLAEMTRVAARHLLVSVPREPLWRVLNVARGAYLRGLGNTPGHVGHFSAGAFVRLVERYGEVIERRSPLPWTMLLVRVS